MFSTEEAPKGGSKGSVQGCSKQEVPTVGTEAEEKETRQSPKKKGRAAANKNLSPAAIEMARVPKMRPRTKQLCVQLHHFRDRVKDGSIPIHKNVPTRFQLAGIAAKGQPELLFVSQREREKALQWEAEDMTKDGLKLPAKNLRACKIIEALQAGTISN